MKIRINPFFRAATFASLITISLVPSAGAATGTWSGATNGIWDTADTNWSGVSGTPWDATNGPGNTVIFNLASLAATVSGPVFTNGITFSITGALSGDTINLAGTAPTISVATGQTGSISSILAGNAGLIKSDAGILSLSGANTYTGGTTVNAGRLILVNNKTGSSDFITNAELEFNLTTGDQTLNGGTISGTGDLIKTGGYVLKLGGPGSPQIIAFTGASSIIDVQGGTVQNDWGNSAWGGNKAGLKVASGATFDVNDGNVTVDELNGSGTIKGGNQTLTIGINNGTGSFTGELKDGLALVKEGTGTQTLSGNISYNGGTTVNGGRLVLVDNTTGSSNFTTNADLEFNITTGSPGINGGTINGTGNLIKTGSGTLQLVGIGSSQTIALTGATSIIDVQGGTLKNDYGNSAWGSNKAGLNVASGATFDIWDGTATVDEVTGSGTINMGWYNDRTLTFGINNGSGTFSGTVSNPTGNLLSITKEGTGTQTFTGSVGNKGLTTVNGGRLVLVDTVTGGANFTTNAELEFNITSGNKQLANGTINGTGNLIKTGAGELWLGAGGQPQNVALTGASSIIDVQGGKLRNEYFNSAWGSNKAGLTVASGATFDVWDGDATVDELNGSGTVTKGQTGTNTLTIGVNNGSGTLTGAITQTAGTLNLIKNGTGTQTLSGTNTYTGTTTINAGRLLVNGSTAAGSSVYVASGATLGGTGTIGGTLALTGILAPGDGGIESLDVSNEVTWKGAASAAAATLWQFELGAANTADLLNITGNFTKDNSAGSVFGFDFMNSNVGGTFKLVDWSNTTNFVVDNFTYTNLGAGLTGTFSFNGSSLEFTAVPEPTSALAGLLITAGLLRRRRR